MVVVDGLTDSGEPLPTSVPPHEPVYQSTVWPPPTVAVSEDDAPAQSVAGVAAGLVGVAGSALTVTETVAQAALTQPVVVLRDRAKYVVVEDGLTDNGDPLPTSAPPHEPVYQSTVWPAGTVALKDDEAPEQMDEGVAAGLVGVDGNALTVTVAVAQFVLTQPVVVFRARAKYVVVAPGLTASEEPLPTSMPLQDPVYQSTVSPPPTVAVSDEEAPAQMADGVAAGPVGVAGAVQGQSSSCTTNLSIPASVMDESVSPMLNRTRTVAVGVTKSLTVNDLFCQLAAVVVSLETWVQLAPPSLET